MFGDPATNSKNLPIATLQDLGTNLDNRRIPITGGDRKAGEYPYYGASGIVDYVADYIFDDDLLLISEDGANLVARVTPIAFPSTGKVWINNHAHVIKFNSMAMQCYVENLLNMMDISLYVTGTAQPKLNQAKLNSIPIPVPEEDQIREYLEFVKQSDKSKFVRFKSQFIEMFGDPEENPMNWPIKQLSDVAKVDGTMTKEYEKYANLPHIGIDSIEKNTGILSGYRTVKEDNVISPKYHFGPQHILYSKIRPALNKVAVPDFEGLCSADCYPLLPIDGFCERKFLAHVLRSDYFLRYVLSFSVRSQMPKVNRKQLEGFRFPCPPVELQRKFIILVEQSDKSK